MNIAIMGSLDFAHQVGEIKKQLELAGHEVSVPFTMAKILAGEITQEKILDMKQQGTFADYTKSKDLIRLNWERMKKSEAILVVNLTKKGIENYIGPNTFLEIGFAHVLGLKIFLWHPIPKTDFLDEITAIQPAVVNENISLIQ